MKQIKFKPRMTNEHKQRLTAVAYATQKVGGWQSANVTADLIDWLTEDGFNVEIGAQPGGKRLNITNVFNEAMVWLADNGYAARVVKGKRTTEFIMDPEVNVPVPDYAKGKQFKLGNTVTATATVSPLEPAKPAPKPKAPPLPSSLRGPDTLRLNVMLKQWWQREPEAAQAWIDRVCDDLGAT